MLTDMRTLGLNLTSLVMVAVVVVIGAGAVVAVGPTPETTPTMTSDVPPPALGSSFVRFELPGVVALADGQAALTLAHPGGEINMPTTARAGGPLRVSVQAPYADGVYEVRLLASGGVGLAARVMLQRRSERELSYQIMDLRGDPEKLSFPPGQDGLQVTVGFVKGKVETRLVTTARVTCDAVLGLDLDGDGTIDPDKEATRAKVEGTRLQASTPDYGVIPLTTAYDVTVTCDQAIVAVHRGRYDFVQGSAEAFNLEKRRDPLLVQEFGVTFHRSPLVAIVRIPNTMLVPQVVALPLSPTAPESTVDVISSAATPTPSLAPTPTPRPSPTAVPIAAAEEGGDVSSQDTQVTTLGNDWWTQAEKIVRRWWWLLSLGLAGGLGALGAAWYATGRASHESP